MAQERKSEVLLDWLRSCRTGGVHLVERDGTHFLPWGKVLPDVERVAEHLDGAGIAPGARVGIRGDNSYAWLVLDLALIRLSAVPVAIPVPDFKGCSNAELTRRYGLVAVFAARAARQESDDNTVAALETLLELPPITLLAQQPAPEGRRLPAGDQEVFTLAFSSGTAGRTKCLLLAWPGVQALIEAQTAAFPIDSDDRIMVALPLSTFQQSYLCYLAIRNQCSVVLTTAARFMHALGAGRPTILLGPPNFYEFVALRYQNLPRYRRLLLSTAAAPAVLLPGRRARISWRRRVFASFHQMYGGAMRLMLVGSAPVRPQMLDLFARAGFELYQIYGMTEIGYLTWNRPGADRKGSVGRETYPGTVFLGEDGEVLVRHPWHLCVGYEGESAEEVAKVFRAPDVIATGDLGRFEDGYLYLKGRKKNVIVTTGGQKLQLEDLEADLATAVGVSQVTLYQRPAGPGLAMVAWYEGDRGAALDALRPRIVQLNARLTSDVRIRGMALIEGALTAQSPLLNRNLKVNREAVRAATAERLEPVEA